MMRFSLLITLILLSTPILSRASITDCEAYATQSHVTPAHWKKMINAQYKKDVKQWYGMEHFYEIGDKHIPTNEFAYHLAKRLEEKDPHALALVELGYHLKQDKFGTDGFVPPESISGIFLGYHNAVNAKISNGSIAKEDAFTLVLVFMKKKPKKIDPETGEEETEPMSDKWEDYLFVDPLNDPWPSPNEYILGAQDYASLQFPTNIWVQVMGEGKFPFPGSNFIDHELAHLTELMTNPALMKVTRDYYRMALEKPEIWDSGNADYEKPEFDRLRRRVFAVSEFFSLPNLAHTRSIKILFPNILTRNSKGAPLTVEERKDILRLMTRDDLTGLAKRIIKKQWMLFSRQGGGSRDSYNLEKTITGAPHARDLMAIARLKRVPKDPFEYGKKFAEGSANETLFGMASDLEALLDFANDRSDWEIHHQQHNIPYGKFKGSLEKFKQEVFAQLIDSIARIETALAWGLELRLTPQQIMKDASALSIDPNSPTYRYLDAFLPRYSYLRNAFLNP